MTATRKKALAGLVKGHEGIIYGLAGSSVAVTLSALDEREPVLVVGDSADDAGYLYFDLTRLLGEDAVSMLPSGYKRDIKYGQVDEAARVLRTETLNRIASEGKLRFVVSYPEALAERVATRKTIAAHTINFTKGSAHDLTDVEKWLRDNGFCEVDYVYEPGQFAVRGSILDIFGYSNELPYRIDFFGV